jgi:hypothetical protein
MTRHVLKLWTDQFDAMKRGDKLADVRRCDDRNFLRGDELLYRDYTAGASKYSGRALLARVKHLTMCAGLLQLFGRQYSKEGPLIRVVVISVEVLEVGTFERLANTAVVEPTAATTPTSVSAPTRICARTGCGEPAVRGSSTCAAGPNHPLGSLAPFLADNETRFRREAREAAAAKKGGRRG